MAIKAETTSVPIVWLDDAEGRTFFDEQARLMA